MNLTIKLLIEALLITFLTGISWYACIYFDQHLLLALNPTLLFLNILPIALLAILIWSTTRKFFFSIAFISGFLFLLFFSNEIKLSQLDYPVITADLLLLPQIIHHFHLFSKYLVLSTEQTIIVIAYFLIMFGLLIWEPAFPKRSWQVRLFSFVVLTVLFASCFYDNSPVNNLYQQHATKWKPWKQKKNAEHNGLIFSLVKESSNLLINTPTVNQELVNSFFQSQQQKIMPAVDSNFKKPDIIVIMSESYFKPERLNGIADCEFSEEVCVIEKNGLHGKLFVPAFGGATIRTEFEFLTGISLNLYPGQAFPYLTLVTKPTASLAHDLSNLGYETIAIHPHKRTFWNRHLALYHLGFDQFLAEEDFPENTKRVGYYIADSEINQKIFTTLTHERPQFIFAITMENHGPWGKRPNIDKKKRNQISVPGQLSENSHKEWQEYIYHLNNANKAIDELYQFIMKRKKPTVLVFFGDHLPALNDVFDTLGFDIESEHAKTTTNYFIVSNFSKKSTEKNLDVEHLASNLLHYAGLPMTKSTAVSFLANNYFEQSEHLTKKENLLHITRHAQLLRHQESTTNQSLFLIK